MAWTDEQQQAIDTEGRSIIVSAGAGSGKTAVLTARVQRKLLSGIHINELLVLTFTNAAAAEMKNRIRKTINNTLELNHEKDLIDSAYIMTFDAFSLALVKKYHTKLNISNNIKITDEVVIDLKKREMLDSIFNNNYLSPKKDFMKLINDFALKDDEELKEYILKAYKNIELKYDKTEFLNSYFDNFFTDKEINKVVDEFIKLLSEKQNTIIRLIAELNDYFDSDFVSKIENNFKNLVNARTYEEFKLACCYSSITLPRNSAGQGKIIKQEIFSVAKEIKDLCIYSSVNEIKEEILNTYSNTKVIVDILKEFDLLLEEYKREEEIYNFTDISRMAIKVVKDNPDIREELTNSFNEILVDEYQDTSDIQEMFISLISKDNVYMVGDVKQSIYRFRNANPYIFKAKYDDFRDNLKGIKIDLLKNFRSRGEVLNSINLLFELFMDDKYGGADYKVSHKMVFGNNSYINEGKTTQDYNLDVIVYDKEILGNITKDEEEAFIIGNDIKNKITNKYQIFDKDELILRDAQYRDFVILLDKSKSFDLYKKVFEYLDLPLTILKEESLRKDEDVLVIRNLIRLLICIKEKKYDVDFKYSYTSIARSFLYRLSDSEIYECFVHDKFLDSDLYKKCLKLTEMMDIMPLASYLDYVLDEFSYEEKLFTIGGIKTYSVRREYLYNLCLDYQALGKTIYDFSIYLDQIFDNDYDLKFNVNTSSNNSCQIMTIHKSKGLEFPICYFAGFSSKFNMSELKERIIFDNQYGLILPMVNDYYKDTILKTLLKARVKREEISEKIRLLYVALTRAKEKMIIVMPKCEEEVEALSLVPDYARDKYNSFLGIMKSIYSALLPYIRETDILATKDYLKVISKDDISSSNTDKLNVEELNIETGEITDKHYSKDSLHLANVEEINVMKFGTDVHAILEEIDFNNYDLDDYDISDSVKDKINNFVKSDFMKDKLNYQMYKEYEFVYNEDNTISHGIIDLLIDCESYYTIIDYKLKNIDDENYDKQLNGYRKYIKNKTGKDTKCYLYSIIDGNVREVLDV
ncbi:MAG: UvrD-helicase domain-containing protein [Bacilli bacterium]|nr:UvrD-helicase domain-containing protein [Bacilli bacterium]